MSQSDDTGDDNLRKRSPVGIEILVGVSTSKIAYSAASSAP